MIIKKYNSEDEWMEGRMGKVTGTRLKDLISKRGTAHKKGFYEIIAEKVAIPASGENVMDRGHRLETDAIAIFEEKTGKKVNTDLVIWAREDNTDIAISPDGYIAGEKITEACEVKCLNSASHIEAYLNQEIPSEYEYQKIQYFVVNNELEILYFIFYDPRMPKDFFYLTVTRESIKNEINECLEVEIKTLREISEIEKLLTF